MLTPPMRVPPTFLKDWKKNSSAKSWIYRVREGLAPNWDQTAPSPGRDGEAPPGVLLLEEAPWPEFHRPRRRGGSRDPQNPTSPHSLLYQAGKDALWTKADGQNLLWCWKFFERRTRRLSFVPSQSKDLHLLPTVILSCNHFSINEAADSLQIIILQFLMP